jgi:nucleotide-binding universal stress UspA family protein
MFERIVVGVEGSPAGFEALRQAKRLLGPGGRLIALTVVTPEEAVHAGFDALRLADRLWTEAREARAQAERDLADLPGAQARLVHGRPISALLDAADHEQADLVVVGTHGSSRAAGILLGSVATAMLHRARCPVLVARPSADPDTFPHSILVGDDGSAAAGEAVAAGELLAERLGASVRTLTATGGKRLTRTSSAKPAQTWDARPAVDALVAASEEADLLVVGSRGLHGLGALGSVSERVAHRASCSVLVIRPRAHRLEDEPAQAEADPALSAR